MFVTGIDLQRSSLGGALIIALGLLVDDAIISVEMMVVKMEQELGRRAKAASFAAIAAPRCRCSRERW